MTNRLPFSSKMPLKTHEEEEGAVTLSLAATVEMNVNAEVEAVLEKLGGIFTLKKEQERHRRLFSVEKMFSPNPSLRG